MANKYCKSAASRIGNPFMKTLLIAAAIFAISILPAAAADGYAGDKIESVHSAACPGKARRAPTVRTGGGRVTMLVTGSGK